MIPIIIASLLAFSVFADFRFFTAFTTGGAVLAGISVVACAVVLAQA
jgi:hypothetical protein